MQFHLVCDILCTTIGQPPVSLLGLNPQVIVAQEALNYYYGQRFRSSHSPTSCGGFIFVFNNHLGYIAVAVIAVCQIVRDDFTQDDVSGAHINVLVNSSGCGISSFEFL